MVNTCNQIFHSNVQSNLSLSMNAYFRLFLSFLFTYCVILNANEIVQDPYPLKEFEFNQISDFNKDIECQTQHIQQGQQGSIDLGQLKPILSAECEPLATVAGCVNVISGRFFQIEKDLSSNAVEPLNLIRFYDSGNTSESSIGFGFGLQFPLWASDFQEGARHSYAMISEREGFLIPYKCKSSTDSHARKVCIIDPRLTEKGYTNLSRASLSGKANFVNWKAAFRSKENDWILQLGDGSQRIYHKHVKLDKEQKWRMNFPTNHAYLLTKEIKPNGNQILFSYHRIHDKPRLTQVRASNSIGQTLDQLDFEYGPDGCHVKNLSGDSVLYLQSGESSLPKALFEDSPYRKILKKAIRSQGGEITYRTMRKQLHRKVASVIKPLGGFLEIDYKESKSYYPEDDKVKRLLEPVGPNGEKFATYEFDYQKDFTRV